MNARQRLDLLLQGDESLRYLNTHLSDGAAVRPAREADGADPVAETKKAKQGVSGYALPVDFEPEHGMKYPPEPGFPLSYIRSYVVGELFDSEDNHLTQNQDDRNPRRAPKIRVELSDVVKDERGGDFDMNSDEEPVTAIQVTSSFSPAVTMARFPFKYLHGDNCLRVNERFYEGDKFWNRTWDLYYLSVPMTISKVPFLLIPTFQAQALLDEINSALNLNLTLTGVDKEGLVIDINNGKLPQPVYLGRSSTSDRKAKLENRVPSPLENWGPWVQLVEPHVFEEFEKNVKLSVASAKVKKNNNKKAIREVQTKKWLECLGRAQAYFGLRPAWQPNVPQLSFANREIEAIDVLKPAKWAFQDAPIFICIDLEWMDIMNGPLTEVGISTLDMLDLQGVVPGDYGHMWLRRIRSRHLRVKEYRNWVNNDYIQGCPGRFRFGESEFIPSAQISNVVDAAFRPPYMVPLKEEHVPQYKNQKRNVILVGLDLHGDITHLQEAGSRVFLDLNGTSSVIRETIDVAELYRVEAGETQKRGLRALLGLLNILSFDLHNAGNDAYYTLHALVRLMLRVAGERPWGYESPEVSIVEPNVKRSEECSGEHKDMPDVTTNPKDQCKDKRDELKFESMVKSMSAMCEEVNDNTDDAGEGPVWSH
ncbi:uncharacterized protein N7479_007598 [Penicillium vulpinum]|uniref:Gfd2/YDR514C-like C-terminal domain-containing protein n=1 Tax=Penicillium vulpinum TaxID=29845 RepID=A0A1V6SA15_9EURO|nr:uncharacterized protein N7479_007598 [Penicillium vulpinum]KAJ5960448.1 hypothetical protein N7479_007598 [Penicillium vulpinum]OQE10726.1 hypothetical protein PENVUL_c003G04835 [Penicillium vulpinum]